MMKRRTYLIIIFFLIGLVLFYLLYFFIYSSISQNRLKTIIEHGDFHIGTIMNISKERITGESETYNQGKFIEYDCLIDSSYCITLINIGKLGIAEKRNNIVFVNQRIPDRQNWFNYDIATPYPISNIPMNHVPWYNTSLLPLNEINNISVFIEGDILNEDYIGNSLLSYSIKSPYVSFAFNNVNKSDLFFSYIKKNDNPLSTIFFYIDGNNNFYIGFLSTIRGYPRSLREVITGVNG